uniref:STAS domain-containing protein n=1 Tax=Panagrellus redivivus TaxID=6233 RepID=A0A7E4VVR4_PANRE
MRPPQADPPRSSFRRRPRERIDNATNRLRKRFTPRSLARTALAFVPILKWLPAYDWRRCFFHDVSGGLSMAVLAVPQGIAHAGIVGVDPVYGLYTAIFPPFLYMIFGNSQFATLGGFAVLSLMTKTAISKVMNLTQVPEGMDIIEDITDVDNTWLSENATLWNETMELMPDNDAKNGSLLLKVALAEALNVVVDPTAIKAVTPIHVATTIMFVSGIAHILMGFFRFDLVLSFLSEQIISGFLVAGSVHVFFAQIGFAIGIDLPTRSGIGHLYQRFFDLVESIDDVHIPTLIISICSVGFLLFSQLVIQPWLANVFDFPVPYELILVIVGITATNFADLSTHHTIQVVGNIPTEFPPPSLPRFDLIPQLVLDTFGIAFTAVCIHLTVADIVKQRYHYHFENWRELYALGIVGAASSFFPVFPVTSVFTRAVENSTQMTVCFSSLALLAVILYIGPALEYLPKCILASMVLFIFIMSVILPIVTDLATGLFLSICFAAFTVFLRINAPRWHILTRVEDSHDYREASRKELNEVAGTVCVFRFDAPLTYYNGRTFVKNLRMAHKRFEKRDANTLITDDMGLRWRVPGRRAKLVIDCSGFPFVDHIGLTTLIRLYAELEKDGIVTVFAAPKAQLLRIFETTDFYSHIPRDRVFAHLRVAVHVCERLDAKALPKSKSTKSLHSLYCYTEDK